MEPDLHQLTVFYKFQLSQREFYLVPKVPVYQ